MAKFEKGVSGNLGGRPKGSKNKITNKMLETISLIFESNIQNLIADFSYLDPKDRVNAMLKLCDYFVPKATTHIDLSSSSSSTVEEQLEELINSRKER